MKVVIAEKPSAAREIAVLLGANEKKDGYLAGNGYFVTWALGHLVGLGLPEDYGIKGFEKSSLPILPDPFLLTVRKQKIDAGYTADAGAQKQLKTIKYVVGLSDLIIVATDAGREGELIFRYIYEYLEFRKPFVRLWISNLTEKAIRKGLENLKPASELDGLYLAAQARSRADWLVGINASQALSLAQGDGVFSLGRVQTPTLALVCSRYLENKSFNIEPYWQLQLTHSRNFMLFTSISEKRWDNKRQAMDALRAIERNAATAWVSSVEIKNSTEQPPLLFDLTGLQKQASTDLSLSAGETLSIAQSLYEKQFISYPRTGSRSISADVWDEIPSLIKALGTRENFREAISTLKLGRLNKRIVSEAGVTDHHGLLPTERIPSALSGKETAIYNLIAGRLLEAVSEPCIKEITKVNLQVLHFDFILSGSRIIESGWRGVKARFLESGEPGQELPEIKRGDELKIKESAVLEKATSPPALYTEAGLLSVMENAGKKSQDLQERKILQAIGIGTPATRAAIIETLFDRKYIQRQGKSLIPTEKGLMVYELVKDKRIADVAMTAQWETELWKIENKEADAATFQKQMESYATSITKELLETPRPHDMVPDLCCPRCNINRLLITENMVKCPEKECRWVQFRNVCGVQISLADIEILLRTGRTPLLKGMKSRAGKSFDAYIVMNYKAETSFEFAKK
ncbi:type IA DNA topoisomerase [Flavobacterium johnsoniae]|uniref:DNA topoisomerase n=1 Tax=Flavobacterium johnsoniae (strain ATCC 17061 / DSM 2064 / JCM 8514 / BCRC 14874 / CCUG 350202 / NBRC 14942 / NCIMB 11054 / UW101) TaxID=376686 RepID=A5FFH7_FLAJ1|nr:type IA DNA topoisomerase [Flavobacterium johnsoniae]ABQ06042.1 DNA topoisomerase [Flavobacterium johnsoniae UW101]OXG00594.1 DNA topoisomerase III [Flavobacterium johnsoniae UW101]WQG81780.1 DNA topoisomerase [Flavobacterium johnsoniae UW101]SHK64045.1 DNA topoisomerase-3 [Flavobacterium johnsoniae]